MPGTEAHWGHDGSDISRIRMMTWLIICLLLEIIRQHSSALDVLARTALDCHRVVDPAAYTTIIVPIFGGGDLD